MQEPEEQHPSPGETQDSDEAHGHLVELTIRPSHDLRRQMLRRESVAMDLGPVRDLLAPLYHDWYHECIECGRSLDESTYYYVERAVRRGEPLFEYALCEDCVYAFQDEISSESTRIITEYWLRHYDLDRRGDLRSESAGSSALPLLGECVFTHRPASEIDEYQIWAWMCGNQLSVDDYAPALCSTEIIESVAELLSKKTRERLDDFVRDRLGLPPELQQLPLLV